MPKARKAIPDGPYTVMRFPIENGPERSDIHRLKGPRLSQWGERSDLLALALMLNIAYAEGAKSAKRSKKR